MKKTLLTLFGILLLSGSVFSQTFNNWRGPERDGHFPDKNLLKQWPANGPRMIWANENLGK
jgi:outer membrane protein assembly factor BamB